MNSVKDIDECATKTHQCHQSAECINHENGYSCECATGYIGNGFHCHDINECAISNQICGPVNEQTIVNGRVVKGQASMGMCINTEGSYECICPDGYEFTRGHCNDINECEHDICVENAICTNLLGSFECNCPSNMINNGTSCIPEPVMVNDAVGNSSARFFNYELDNYDYNYHLDIQTCEDLQVLCIEPEICLDTEKGPMCHMPLHLQGDYDTQEFNYEVIEFDEDYTTGICTRDKCPKHSDCWELADGHTCTCHQGMLLILKFLVIVRRFFKTLTLGYEMTDSGECINIDECSAGSHTCDQNAECLDLFGSYACTCNYGFEGNGTVCTEGASILSVIKLTKLKMLEGKNYF